MDKIIKTQMEGSTDEPEIWTEVEYMFFGNRKEVPHYITYVIDCRTDEELEASPLPASLMPNEKRKLARLPMLKDWEPVKDDQFRGDFGLIMEEVGNQSCYIYDTQDCSRSSMLIVIMMHEIYKHSAEDSFQKVEKAYFTQNKVDPKWRTVGLPRRSRHRMFADWIMSGVCWKTYMSKFVQNVKGTHRAQRARCLCGSVRVSQMPKRHITPSVRMPYIASYHHITLSIWDRGEWSDLHPVSLQRIMYKKLLPDGTLVNAIAGTLLGLVLSCHVYSDHLNANDELNPRYFEIAEHLATSCYYMASHPHARGREPVFYMWEGTRLSKLQFRVVVFTHMYADLVQRTERFDALSQMRLSGWNLHLLDYDSYDYFEEGSTLKQAMLNPNKPWGHSMILAGLLTNCRPWNDEKLEL